MEPLSFAQLIEATDGRLEEADPHTLCRNISTDSRTLQPGDVFWALVGDHHDGHDYASDALERGACLVVCQEDRQRRIVGPKLIVKNTLTAWGALALWYRKKFDPLMIGVTGSVGKTTTKELLHRVLSRHFSGICSPHSFNNAVGVPHTLLQLEQGHSYGVVELGASQPGDIRQLCEIVQPEFGVVTAIGKAHLVTLHDLEGVMRVKGELLASLPTHGTAFLCADDPLMQEMATRADCRVVWVGVQADADYKAEHVHHDGLALQLVMEGTPLNLPGIGLHLLHNVLLTWAVAREVGIAPAEIAEAVAGFEPLPGRGRWLACGPWLVLDEAYNANPTSMQAALQHGCQVRIRGKRRYAVLGDMLELGSAAEEEHWRMGYLAATCGYDGVLAYGLWSQVVAAGALEGGLRRSRLVATHDLDVLYTMLDCWLEPGDLIVIKGSRAMRMERVVEWLARQVPSGAHLPQRRAS
ncbi:MAG: UDP-N-acetylmuramoyl-tripeptide--D-alanyl-D-alanine ligase [Planctomycetaceae bacterium]|nr:MAG: UDP-N-acetylmuramoyl-tripeptide--D-alanyl-D-alanine ligase [Planctomycetaceae bacterium]